MSRVSNVGFDDNSGNPPQRVPSWFQFGATSTLNGGAPNGMHVQSRAFVGRISPSPEQRLGISPMPLWGMIGPDDNILPDAVMSFGDRYPAAPSKLFMPVMMKR